MRPFPLSHGEFNNGLSSGLRRRRGRSRAYKRDRNQHIHRFGEGAMPHGYQ